MAMSGGHELLSAVAEIIDDNNTTFVVQFITFNR